MEGCQALGASGVMSASQQLGGCRTRVSIQPAALGSGWEHAASAGACKGYCVTVRLESWWMLACWEPCKTNLLCPCWYDFTLSSERVRKMKYYRGAHKAEPIGPYGSLSPASAIPGIMSAQHTQRHRTPLCQERCVRNTMTCKAGSFKVKWNKSWLSPRVQNGCSSIWLLCTGTGQPQDLLCFPFLINRFSLSPVPCRSRAPCLHVKWG